MQLLTNTFSAKQVTLDSGRHYEIIENDGSFAKHLKSVTTIVGSVEPKGFLTEWRERVGTEEANRISTFSSSTGSKVHDHIEKYFLHKHEPEVLDDVIYACYSRLRPILDLITPFGIEHRTYWYNDELGGFSGTFDIGGFIDGTKLKKRDGEIFSNESIPFIGDWKNWLGQDKKGNYKIKYPSGTKQDGSKFYPLIKYCIQIAAYIGAVNQRTNAKYSIKNGFIFGVTPTCRQPFIYHLNNEAIYFYWLKMKDILYAYNNNSYFDWKQMEYEADRNGFLGDRCDILT